MVKLKHLLSLLVKWTKMLIGKSNLHAAQPINISYVKGDFLAYPNDLSAKLQWQGYPDAQGIRRNILTTGELKYFPIAICQRALAIFQYVYIDGNLNNDFKTEFKSVCDWLVNSLDQNNCLDCWSVMERNVCNNYSSMAQGEAISVLVRGYYIYDNQLYLNTAKKLFDGLKTDVYLTVRKENSIYFSEFPNKNNDIVLNGWIFTLWGLVDLSKFINDPILDKMIYESYKTLSNSINTYNYIFGWSKYDSNNISSPFYHKLHISMLEAVYIETNDEQIKKYLTKWQDSNSSIIIKCIMVVIKAIQKLRQPQFKDFVG